MAKRKNAPSCFERGEWIQGLCLLGTAHRAGYDFGGPFLIMSWWMNDAGGLIYLADELSRLLACPDRLRSAGGLHRGDPDMESSQRFAALYRLLLDAASARGWRERRALEVLMQDDATEHDGVIRLLCGKAGRHLTPDDVQEAFRLSGWGGPLYIVSREFALKHHRRATRSARR